MPTSSRFAVAIHILSLLALNREDPMRSEDIAGSVGTNAAVVRRIIGSLVAAGLVQTRLGHGGGAILARPTTSITLRDVFQTVEEGEFFALPHSVPNGVCYVGHNILPVLGREFARLESMILSELGKVMLSDVIDQIQSQAGYMCNGNLIFEPQKAKV
jgi:DNA-binding IscR family transcriptional regulator